MSEYTEAQVVLFDIYENVLDFKDTITSKAFENADKALEIADRLEQADVVRTITRHIVTKKLCKQGKSKYCCPKMEKNCRLYCTTYESHCDKIRPIVKAVVANIRGEEEYEVL